MNTIKDEYYQLIKKNFDDIVYNAEYKSDVISSDVKNAIIKHMICKCINSQHKYNLIKTGIKCVCSDCNGEYPYYEKIPITSEYTNILNYFNVNVTVNNYNNYNNDDNNNNLELLDSDIKIDNCIFNDNHITNLINKCLSGHKINDFSKLLHNTYSDFAYDGDWYCYTNGLWKRDIEELILKSKILDLKDFFSKISNYYKINKSHESPIIIKNILSLKIKLSKPSFKDEIVKESKLLYVDFAFSTKLNQKKRIIPFLNGLYDLNFKKFRPYIKEDYISITCNYNYDDSIHNKDATCFLKLLLENCNMDYILKKLSESLYNNIINYTLFVCNDDMNISILFNFIKLTYGNLFKKMETNSLIRKRNVNELNDKIKYVNSYIIYITEFNDKKISLELLDELLTGEIYIKTSYKETIINYINSNIYITIDKVPDIKYNLKHKVNIIHLTKSKSEIDYDYINILINNDISWRQTFMNMLIEYYYKHDIKQTIEIPCNELRNDFTYLWLENHIILCENNILNLKELCKYYYSNQSVHSKLASILKKEVEIFLKKKYPVITYNFRDTTFKNKKVRGWVGIGYKG